MNLVRASYDAGWARLTKYFEKTETDRGLMLYIDLAAVGASAIVDHILCHAMDAAEQLGVFRAFRHRCSPEERNGPSQDGIALFATRAAFKFFVEKVLDSLGNALRALVGLFSKKQSYILYHDGRTDAEEDARRAELRTRLAALGVGSTVSE